LVIDAETLESEKIDIRSEITLVLRSTYLSKFWCSVTPSCTYSTNRLWTIKYHESVCTDEVHITYKQTVYGGKDRIRNELVNLGIIPQTDNNLSKFATFDIESFNVEKNERVGKKTLIHAKQECVSIAVTCGFVEPKDYIFIRKDMSHASGIEMVQTFLDKLETIHDEYFANLPQSAKLYYDQIKEEIKN